MNDDGYKERKKDYSEKAKAAKTTGMKFTTVSGRPVDVLYGPDDVEHIN